jgi:hypothetical protein
VFAATLFSFVAGRFGVVASVRWALFLCAFIYLLHPLAVLVRGHSRAGTWGLVAGAYTRSLLSST